MRAMVERRQAGEGSAGVISLLSDGLALVYHEARHVRFLIRARHRPGAGWEQLVSLPRNRVEAWRAIWPVRESAARRPHAGDAARLFEERFGRSLEDLQVLYADPHWKHATAVGGHAWRDVASSVIALRDAIDQAPPGVVDPACARLLGARHNNGLVRDKIVELDHAVGIATNSWWREPRLGA